MRKSFFVIGMFLILPFASLIAETIESYEELVSAMKAGRHFVIILDLVQATGKPSMPTGYFQPKSMMLMPATETTEERLMTSYLHFSDLQGKPRYEYIKFTFAPDQNVVVHYTIYNAQDFSQIGTTQHFDCSLGNGIEVHVSVDSSVGTTGT